MLGSPDKPYTLDIWGQCTDNQFYGCSRTSNGYNIINPITSARLNTKKSFWFKYGRVEFRSKLPKGDWLWPAVWLLPKYEKYGMWPASGEIDFLESRGNDASYSRGGFNSFSSTLHWGPFYNMDPFNKTYASYIYRNGKNFNDDFHTFGMIWDETKIETYLDHPDNIVLSKKFSKDEPMWKFGNFDKYNINNPWEYSNYNAPFDQEFYFILNVAVGGVNDYFPDGVNNKPWTMQDNNGPLKFWNDRENWLSSWYPETNRDLQIDYIKVWSFPESTYGFNNMQNNVNSYTNNNSMNIYKLIVIYTIILPLSITIICFIFYLLYI